MKTLVRHPTHLVDYTLSWLDMAWQCHHCEFKVAYQGSADAADEDAIRQHVQDGHPAELVQE